MTSDVIIQNDYPGAEYIETVDTGPGPYAEDREVDGAMWRVQNAQFNKDDQNWYRQVDGQPAFAVVQQVNGSISYYRNDDDASWPASGWTGNGQRGIYNVVDFGALANGDNDAPAIQLAADAANSGGGGVVLLPPGTYVIYDTILLGSNTTLLGLGPAVSILQAHEDMNGFSESGPTPYMLNVAMVANSSYASPEAEPQTSIAIRNVGFNGNGTNNVGTGNADTTIEYGLITFVNVIGQLIEGCAIYNSSGDGVYLESTPASVADVTVADCTIDLLSEAYGTLPSNVYGSPILGININEAVIRANEIGFGNVPNGTVMQSTSDAIAFQNSTTVTITSNQLANCANGVSITDGSNVIISNNVAISCTASGILANGSSTALNRVVISGNTIDSPNTAGVTVSGEAVAGQINVVVSNNIINAESSSSTIIGIALQADFVTCHHNVIDLLGSDSIGIQCDADHLMVDGNYVVQAGATAFGVTIVIPLAEPRNDVQVIDNNLAALSPGNGLSLSHGTFQTDFLGSVIRGNVGVNPYGGLTAPSMTSGLVNNPFPFDCMVYIAGGASVAVSVDTISTGLGSGLGYFVEVGSSIQVSYTTAPTWVWVAN
jgi:hypothetical protein